MLKKIFASIFMIAFLFAIASCGKDDKITDGGTDPSNYYPSASGNYYKYSIDRTDSTGTHSTGTSSSTFNGTKTFLGTEYQIKIDSINIANVVTANESYVRTTQAGVYAYFDTSGVSEFIPDTLLQYITISNEMTLYSFPFTAGKAPWSVFKMSLSFGFIKY